MDREGFTTRSIIVGAIWMVACALELAILATMVKAASVRFSTGEILWFQNWIALLIATPFVLRKGVRGLKPELPWLQLARAVGGVATLYLYFLSIRYIPVVNAVLATNTAPLWVPIIAYFWLKSPIRHVTWIGIVLGFVGVGVILYPGFSQVQPALLIALSAGLLMGVTFVVVQMVSRRDSPFLTVFYYFLLSTIVTSPLAIVLWVTPQGVDWFLLIGMGIFHGVSALSMVTAMKHGPASIISPLYYLSVPATGLLEWVFWQHVPNWPFYLGAILVVGGGVWTIETGRRALRPPKQS